MAGVSGAVHTVALQGAVVQTAACDLHLCNAAVGQDLDFFRTALAGSLGGMSLAVIEDVPLVVALYNAAVVVARAV